MGEEGLRGPPGATGPQGPAGGGGGGTTGTATINFGATPVDSATVVVTGQAGITATSAVRAFFLDDTTGDNDAQAHLQAGALMPLVVGNRVVATGFTIYADVIAGMVTGQFKCTFAY